MKTNSNLMKKVEIKIYATNVDKNEKSIVKKSVCIKLTSVSSVFPLYATYPIVLYRKP